ncbi:unnamed protein product [Owenia fusiformis]|uniref:Uncharacterized protein n=1 Tax=Owenia fusiformis TaxID=6347 RepID=A0A8J1TVS6_OWEFU|nr:unnamed protein product [Owenia fusiformis]
MIEVIAQLQRGSVFLAGEHIECTLTIRNIVGEDNQVNRTETLAWMSAQIHCQCSVSEARVGLAETSLLTTAEVTAATGNDTSFVPSKGERGYPVLSTKPKILFCDLKLQTGESKSYTYKEKIPLDAPPSFRGTAVKYSYKITVGTQRLDSPIKLLRVPFRVLVVCGLNDMSVYNESEEMVGPSNPFLAYRKPENTVLDIALQVLSMLTARKGPNFYNITNTRGKVARFCLFKQAYRIGEDVIGAFDFDQGTIPCVQYSVTLQSEEQISEGCRKKGTQGSTITSYTKQQECCLHTIQTHISVPIPLTASPAFQTDIVSLKWRLHFEFVTSLKPIEGPVMSNEPSEGSTWTGPEHLDVETMVWDLPIKVFATNPLAASSVSLLRTCSSIAL